MRSHPNNYDDDDICGGGVIKNQGSQLTLEFCLLVTASKARESIILSSHTGLLCLDHNPVINSCQCEMLTAQKYLNMF